MAMTGIASLSTRKQSQEFVVAADARTSQSTSSVRIRFIRGPSVAKNKDPRPH